MKKLLKNIAYFLLSFFKHEGAVVLMYHSIGNNREFFTVSEEEFGRQMKYLRDHEFNVVSLIELVGILKNNLPIPEKTIAITFDDGYEDNLLVAQPILSEYNFPATIFVSTANMGETILGRRETELKIVSAEEIKEVDRSGLIDFESHSNYHVKLPSLSDDEISEQLSSSKKILEEILGRAVDMVAYPSGKTNKKVIETAKKYYSVGVGVQKGRVIHGDNIMEIRRNSVDREVSFTQFKGIAAFGRI